MVWPGACFPRSSQNRPENLLGCRPSHQILFGNLRKKMDGWPRPRMIRSPPVCQLEDNYRFPVGFAFPPPFVFSLLLATAATERLSSAGFVEQAPLGACVHRGRRKLPFCPLCRDQAASTAQMAGDPMTMSQGRCSPCTFHLSQDLYSICDAVYLAWHGPPMHGQECTNFE